MGHSTSRTNHTSSSRRLKSSSLLNRSRSRSFSPTSTNHHRRTSLSRRCRLMPGSISNSLGTAALMVAGQDPAPARSPTPTRTHRHCTSSTRRWQQEVGRCTRNPTHLVGRTGPPRAVLAAVASPKEEVSQATVSRPTSNRSHTTTTAVLNSTEPTAPPPLLPSRISSPTAGTTTARPPQRRAPRLPRPPRRISSTPRHRSLPSPSRSGGIRSTRDRTPFISEAAGVVAVALVAAE